MSVPFLLHWVDQVESVWDEYGALAVNDEDVITFEVSQEEGDFASLSIDVRNPRIGLLSIARKQHAWLSWDRAWVPLPPQQEGGPVIVDDHIPDYVPLFFGRLDGIPSRINQEIVTLVLTARPADFVAQKTAIAAAFKLLGSPYYDAIFVNPANIDDPDTVLEARTELWSIDRVTGQVSTSDILSGEDGVQAFVAEEIPYDSVDINIAQAPIRSVTVNAKLNWGQVDSGVIDFGTRTFETYTGASVIQDWVKPGVSLQAGYSVEAASVEDLWKVDKAFTATYSTSWNSIEPKHLPGDTISSSASSTIPVLQGPGQPYLSTILSLETNSAVGEASVNSQVRYVLKYLLRTSLSLRYNANRPRVEQVSFTLQSNIQSLVTDPGDAENLVLEVSSVDLGLALPSLEVPIESVSQSQFLTSDRGIEALEYLIAWGRAHLIASSRAVEVKWKCLFERAIQLSCRMNASIEDPRLPGGSAIGKIIAYSFKGDGPTGEVSGQVTIGCAIGYGGSAVAEDGEPDYCEADYVEAGYQVVNNEVRVLTGGDVGYTVPIAGVVDDGLVFPLTKDQVVVREEWHGSLEDQEQTINATFPTEIAIANAPAPLTLAEQESLAVLTAKEMSEVMKDHSIWYDLELKPLNAPFTAIYVVQVSQLEIPQMINLEAA